MTDFSFYGHLAHSSDDLMFVVVAYDIAGDKRRTRISDLLVHYGDRVNYSVFECELTISQFGRMREEIRETINPRKDNVRYYFLCQSCRAKKKSDGYRIGGERREIEVV